MRDQIIQEIRRLAALAGGKPPGKMAFARQTGIPESAWSGRLWARWGDAVAEAGFTPNTIQTRIEATDMLSAVIEACRHFGRIPTVAEFKLYKQGRPRYPSKGAITGHFGTRARMIEALARHAATGENLEDIAALVAAEPLSSSVDTAADRLTDGHVYLLKSGEFYKVGRSDELERRVKEVRTQMPEALTLVHAIRTDDPPGIESYWHRRFADQRRNGEWFRLSPGHVAAFKRRKYQ